MKSQFCSRVNASQKQRTETTKKHAGVDVNILLLPTFD